MDEAKPEAKCKNCPKKYNMNTGARTHLDLKFYREWQGIYQLLQLSVFQLNKFSHAGDLITKKRNRLLPKSIKEVMCLNSWLKLDFIKNN